MNFKTVVIVNDFNFIQGGASKVAIETARILKEEGIKVYFFSAVNKNVDLIDGVEYISTNQNEALKEKNKLKGAINGIYNFKARNKMKTLLKELDRDTTIIHIHGWTKALSSSIFDIAFKMNFKIVLTLHDYFTACPNGGYFNYKQNKICKLKPLSAKCIKCNCDSRNYGFKIYRIIRQIVQNKIVKLNDRLENVISISEMSEKILKNTLGKNTKITRIYNPINIEKNEERVKTENNNYYLYVGRISKEKGVDVFERAITELGVKGIVVGDGEERKKLEKQYPNIEITGWKDKKIVKNYMGGARALIFPSRWYECQPLTILEAQSIGLPVICSNKCTGIEFVGEDLTFDTENIDSLKQVIQKMFDDNYVKNISVNLYKKWNKDYIKLYKEKIITYFEEISK